MSKLSDRYPVQTRDGKSVTIYTWNAPGPYPIHGLIAGYEEPSGWTEEGFYFSEGDPSDTDLVLEREGLDG